MGKYGQNRRRYRAIARTETAAERNEREARYWEDRHPGHAERCARTALRQRTEVITLMRRVNFSDPYLNK